MYESLFNRQKQFYQSESTRSIQFRISALKQLKRSIQYYEAALLDAMKKDFNKGEAEAYLTEIGYAYNDINFTIKHLKEWAETEKVKTPVTHIGSTSKIYKEPYGVTLIIAPWNYPFNLTVAPLIGAISAREYRNPQAFGTYSGCKPCNQRHHIFCFSRKVYHCCRGGH